MKKTFTGLLSTPLIREALSDPHIKIVKRGIDNNWVYEGISKKSVTAFNPFHCTIYIAETSALAEWIKHGKQNDRKFNEGDFLVGEALFLAHDYLHAWAVLYIQEQLPELGYGTKKITAKNIEDFAFCHIVTEAVATVGLDYWYLSTIDFNSLTDLGTKTKNLTVGYHERDLREFKKFNPDFVAQNPAFFESVAQFYCTGEFTGFSLVDIRRSPKLLGWLEHELSYGQKQREYTRAWLQHLSGGAVSLNPKALGDPILAHRPWQVKLLRNLGQALWKKVKNGERALFKSKKLSKNVWRCPPERALDFRFTNSRSLSELDISSIKDLPHFDENFTYFFNQFICSHEYKTFPKEFLAILRYIEEKKDLESLFLLFKKLNVKRLPFRKESEPRDLFFPN